MVPFRFIILKCVCVLGEGGVLDKVVTTRTNDITLERTTGPGPHGVGILALELMYAVQ